MVNVTEREVALDRFMMAMPTLRDEGWILTPHNTSVSADGVVVLRMRHGDEDLGRVLVERLRRLDPTLSVEILFSRESRHVIVRI